MLAEAASAGLGTLAPLAVPCFQPEYGRTISTPHTAWPQLKLVDECFRMGETSEAEDETRREDGGEVIYVKEQILHKDG